MTVQKALLRLILRIDPKDQNGTMFTAGTVGTVDGDKLSAQRQLDIYNDARYMLFQALSIKYTPDEIARLAPGLATSEATLTFSNGGATKPNGYLRTLSLVSPGNVKVNVLPSEYTEVVRLGQLPSYVESATRLFVIDSAQKFQSVHGNTFVTDGDYKFTYLSLPVYALSDVTGGATIEAYNDEFNTLLLEIAQAIAVEQGYNQVLELAKSLVGAK